MDEDAYKNIAVSAFSITHVEYARGDPVGFLAAGLSLAPVFLIVALVAAAIARRDPHCAAALLGQVLNTAWNIALKRVLRQPRPPFLHQFRPAVVGFSPHGMPSNHSQFVFFFAAYWCSYLLRSNNNRPAPRTGAATTPRPGHLCHSVVRPVAVVVIPLCAALVSAGRVYLTYHTPAQVVVGALVGVMTGLCWYAVTWKFIAPVVFPRIAASYIGRGLGIVDATGCGSRQDVVLWECENLCSDDDSEKSR
jgi:dolichyldiphosphatase